MHAPSAFVPNPGKAGTILLILMLGVAAPILTAQDSADLVEAARNLDSERVRSLLADGADPDTSEPDGTRALHWASRADDTVTLRALLAAGADPNATNRYGMRPIHLAAVNGNAGTLEALLDAGADPDAPLPEGETPLMTAARTGAPEAIALLLDAGARIDATESWYGEDALIWAAAGNHADATRLLIDRGADPNRRSALLDFESRRSGQSILSLGHWTPLMYAARENAIDAALVLIRGGAETDAADPDGATALIVAIINANYDFADMLLDQGADPNVVDTSAAMGPLYAAVDMNRLAVGHGRPNPPPSGRLDAPAIITSLLEHGADPNAPLTGPIMQRHHTAGDSALGEGATPFMRAAKSGDVGSMRQLLRSGADPMLTMPNGTTALMFAAGMGWRNGSPLAPSYDQGGEDEAVEALDLLLDLGHDLQEINDSGDTALHAAVSGRGSAAIVRFLLDAGADADAVNMRGQSPRDGAAARGSDAVRALLVPETADVPADQ